MLTKILTKIKNYYKSEKEAQELREVFLLDYRIEKEIMAISKSD